MTRTLTHSLLRFQTDGGRSKQPTRQANPGSGGVSCLRGPRLTAVNARGLADLLASHDGCTVERSLDLGASPFALLRMGRWLVQTALQISRYGR